MLRILITFMLVWTAAAPRATAAPTPSEEQHYVVLLGEERAGWMVESQTTHDGKITTSASMQFEIGRGRSTVRIEVMTQFVETEDHTPILMRSSQSIASVPIETVHEFQGDTVLITTTQQGRVSTREVPMPTEPWLTPAQAGALLRESLSAGGPIPDMTVLDPTFGLTPITTSRSQPEQTTIEVFGRTVPAYRTEVTLSAVPGPPSEEFLGLDGSLVRSTTTLGGLSITMLAAERELALAKIDPPEIMRSTFIKPNRPIPNPRQTRSASYVLSVPSGTLGQIPTSPRHSVTAIDDRTARVVVDLDSTPDRSEQPDASHLASSAMLDASDTAITGLVERARPDAEADPAVRAEAMRRFVHGFVNHKSLDVGFASASEVARSRVGDCTEHAVLLAALLRADGIPSRVTSGLVYAQDFAGAENIFGSHRWTLAWIATDGHEPGWVDLDATLPEGIAFDATHIALNQSSMRDGESINSMLALAPLIGRLQVKIESIGE